MTLDLTARVAARDLDLQLQLGTGERVAVLGPNGAGKSSLLALLAGVLRADSGRAELDGQVLFDQGPRQSGGPRPRWLPPHARGIALLAQEPLLFPHLSVLGNVAFGPRAAGQSRRQAGETARRWLAEVEATELADRRPAQLSGGQAQRVAVARALAAEPRLLLLDEPMAALDVGAAPVLRRTLRRVLAGRAAVLVTHDLLDAVLLADRVVVLDAGRVVEAGPTADVIRHPRTPFTARIAGLNLVTGTAEGQGVRSGGGVLVEGRARTDLGPGGAAIAVFPPSAVAVFPELPHGSPRNSFAVTVAELEPRDEQVRVRARTATGQVLLADVTAPVVGELDLYPGGTAYFLVKATAVTLYPA
ncbi:sulfate/molybdate ABC transporter ATP-binding protein [uncultured Friedmanniella sp.]|uniref:sulfate/molybdate ABC transporter ATP-binding protein n=1 Tax=uncultured Friedmanniella sp. TaxID=335381 RepID=UPI0035CBA429